jgi:hypothetical protein
MTRVTSTRSAKTNRWWGRLREYVSIRPATGNVIVFETYEGAPGEDEDDELAGGQDAPATSERTPP